MTEEIISEHDQKIVEECLSKLQEHFDSVRIFVTRHDGNKSETCQFDTGGGNFYAQLGQIQEWLSIQDQYQRDWATRSSNKK